MQSVTDWLTKTTSYNYDIAGRLITTTLPSAVGVTEARSYNNADQLSSIAATKGGGTLTSFSYTLDNAGMRYDQLYRSTAVTYTDSITQTYSYDPVGNRLSKADPSTTITSTYDNGDRLNASGTVTYTYDNNGNQKSRTSGGTTTSYCWDVFNRLLRATDSGHASLFARPGAAELRGRGLWRALHRRGGKQLGAGYLLHGRSCQLQHDGDCQHHG